MPHVVSGYRAVWFTVSTTRRDTETAGTAPCKTIPANLLDLLPEQTDP